MRSEIFSLIFNIVGIPVFIIKYLLKFIWFISYNAVGLLYKESIITGVFCGKMAYTLISATIGVAIVAVFVWLT